MNKIFNILLLLSIISCDTRNNNNQIINSEEFDHTLNSLIESYENENINIIPNDNSDFILFSGINGTDLIRNNDLLLITKHKGHSTIFFLRSQSNFLHNELFSIDRLSIDNSLFDKITTNLESYSNTLTKNNIKHADPKYSREVYILLLKSRFGKYNFQWSTWENKSDIIYFKTKSKKDTFYNHTAMTAEALFDVFEKIKYLEPQIRVKKIDEKKDEYTFEVFLSTEDFYMPNYMIKKLNYIKVNGVNIKISNNHSGIITLKEEFNLSNFEIIISATDVNNVEKIYRMN